MLFDLEVSMPHYSLGRYTNNMPNQDLIELNSPTFPMKS